MEAVSATFVELSGRFDPEQLDSRTVHERHSFVARDEHRGRQMLEKFELGSRRSLQPGCQVAAFDVDLPQRDNNTDHLRTLKDRT